MTRRKMKREQENPGKKIDLVLRGEDINELNIVRFQRRKNVGEEDELTHVGLYGAIDVFIFALPTHEQRLLRI